jgi:hypothetical protein
LVGRTYASHAGSVSQKVSFERRWGATCDKASNSDAPNLKRTEKRVRTKTNWGKKEKETCKKSSKVVGIHTHTHTHIQRESERRERERERERERKKERSADRLQRVGDQPNSGSEFVIQFLYG